MLAFLLESGQVLCPDSSQMHQMHTENQQTRESAGSQMLLVVEEWFYGCSTIWPITLLSNYVLQCHLMKLCSVTWQAVIECMGKMNEHPRWFTISPASSRLFLLLFFFSPAGRRKLKKRREIAGCIRPKAINKIMCNVQRNNNISYIWSCSWKQFNWETSFALNDSYFYLAE